MRLGLFGGTFDPIHQGHLLLAEFCREQCRLDEIRFLPAGVPPHKKSRVVSPSEDRVAMLELATAGHPAFTVCRYEIDRDTVSYTVDTLAYFHEQEPDAELFFLLGADMLHDLPRWYEPRRVCQLATPIVVGRSGVASPNVACLASIATRELIESVRRHQVAMPQVGISSTELRRRVAAGESIRYQTPRAVQKYIETHRLYRDTPPTSASATSTSATSAPPA